MILRYYIALPRPYSHARFRAFRPCFQGTFISVKDCSQVPCTGEKPGPKGNALLGINYI